jgi:hypothetical protein
MSILCLTGCPTPIENTTADYSPVPTNTDARARTGQSKVIALKEVVMPTSAEESERAQAQIRAGHHSTYSGRIECSGCSGPFLVTVAQFVNPSPDDARLSAETNPMPPTCGVGTHGADLLFPPVLVFEPGPFEIVAPWHGGAVVIEVIEDTDGNAVPSPNERFVVLHDDGGISGREDRSGLVINLDSAPPMVAIGEKAPLVGRAAGAPPAADTVSP